MKRILVTGENSYIGTSFVTYMEQFKEEYEVETISVRGDEWREKDFSIYDAILHVAGIVHKKETSQNEKSYYDVNVTLTEKLAEKAKSEGVKQFVFFSTISVYGKIIGEIGKNSIEKPISYYGKSKLLAEKKLTKLETNDFNITIIRPPMVYGPNCSGNYKKLRNAILKLKMFPNVSNKRSMIYIGNLLFFTKKLIDFNCSGIFIPQNLEFVDTKEMIQEISYQNESKLFLVPFFYNEKNKILNASFLKKILGNLVISTDASFYNIEEELVKEIKNSFYTFEESISITEKGWINK
ncbi:NAD-dependent epimerase/dehydratase family protein [Vagococcus fluvialis]|uniref:NAD-dependent epimerase/dehydratase family protein n=1 Tax=Vagococcus fluvialis TaxID=2738 RepID=UPI002B29F980|nr:NAD-dependent epimerase/dehydratase family protein [Vagococcus fluvialis]